MKATDTVCKATAAAAMNLMGVRRVSKAGITHPFGDERTVTQAFPAGIRAEDADPFLMCDFFDSKETKGKAEHEDDFPVDWHPHRGFDIASYLKSGTGRHGDSLGNRETYETPGMQWMSVGSGVVHAEGGANAKGQHVRGFQIWINVPKERKMESPRYGTVPTHDLPLVEVGSIGKAKARVLAGEAFGVEGPFRTVQSVQMIDFELEPGAKVSFDVAKGMDTAMVYLYDGNVANLNGERDISAGSVILMDANSDEDRGIELVASSEGQGASAMLFTGKKLSESIAWHGPIVMNTQRQLEETFQELRKGTFPPVRVSWDYKRIASKPQA